MCSTRPLGPLVRSGSVKRRRTHYEQMFSAVHAINDIEARLCGLVYKPGTIDGTPDTWRRVFRRRAETRFARLALWSQDAVRGGWEGERAGAGSGRATLPH